MGSQNPDFFHIGEGINFSIQVAKNPRNYFLKILKNFFTVKNISLSQCRGIDSGQYLYEIFCKKL